MAEYDFQLRGWQVLGARVRIYRPETSIAEKTEAIVHLCIRLA